MAGKERLQSMSKLVEDAQKALHDLDAEERAQRAEEFGRLEMTLSYLGIVLERSDPDLLPDVTHTELTRLLELVASQPTSAAANPGTYADGLIVQAAQLPVAQQRDLEQGVKDAVTSFRRSAAQHINALGGDAERLHERLGEIAAAAEKFQSEVKQSSETSTTELETELQAIQTAAAAAKQQVEDLAESQESAFVKEQAAREERLEDRWSEIRERIESSASELVADLDRMRSQAQGLVGAVSVASTANHFRDDAKGERKAYWVLLVLTMFFLGAAVLVAGLAASQSESEVQRLIAKLGVSGALLALGVFTGSRARDHRERDKKSRDKELDMRVFGPFIEPLPPKEQVRERILMARRFFGRTEPSAPDQTDEEIDLLSSPEEIDVAIRDLRQRTTP